MPITLIATVSASGCIGNHTGLLWNLPEEEQHFVKQIEGMPVLLGRHSWDLLPHRHRLFRDSRLCLLTQNRTYQGPEGVRVVHSIEQALGLNPRKRLYVAGGARLFNLAINQADMMHLTELAFDVLGETKFPAFDREAWEVLEMRERPLITFVTYKRRKKKIDAR